MTALPPPPGKTPPSGQLPICGTLYSDLVAQLAEKVPLAETALREGYVVFETQREEIRRIKDEIASVRATGMLSNKLDIESDFQKRADLIRELTESLRTKSSSGGRCQPRLC